MALDYKIYHDFGKQYNRLKLMESLILDSATVTITSSPTTSTDDAFEFLTRNTSTGLMEKLAEPVPLSAGGTGVDLTDPGADRLLFWDDSAGNITWLELGSGLSITGTTISSSASPSEPNTQIVWGTGAGIDSSPDFIWNNTGFQMVINQPGAGTGANIFLTKPAAVGAYPFIEMQYGAIGDGYISIGNASGSGFIPSITMKPDIDLQNFSFIISETGDTGATAAIVLDGRTSSGALATQDVLSISSSNTALVTVTAAGGLKLTTVANDNSEDKLLTWNSTNKLVEYRTVASLPAGSGFSYTVHTIDDTDSPYTVTETSGLVIFLIDATAGDVDIAIPTAVGNTAEYRFKRINSSANNVIVTPDGTETIDNAASQEILFENTAFTIISDNADWWRTN